MATKTWLDHVTRRKRFIAKRWQLSLKCFKSFISKPEVFSSCSRLGYSYSIFYPVFWGVNINITEVLRKLLKCHSDRELCGRSAVQLLLFTHIFSGSYRHHHLGKPSISDQAYTHARGHPTASPHIRELHRERVPRSATVHRPGRGTRTDLHAVPRSPASTSQLTFLCPHSRSPPCPSPPPPHLLPGPPCPQPARSHSIVCFGAFLLSVWTFVWMVLHSSHAL